MGRRRHFAAECVRHELHPVTDAEHRHAGFIHLGLAMRRPRFRHRLRPARQDDTDGVSLADLANRGVERQNLGIYGQLAQTTSDQLRKLRAEIEDYDGLM
jgi:hypothetical protein